MKSIRKTVLAAVFALVFCLCGCVFDTGDDADGGGLRIEGYVRNELGTPVAEVKVKAHLVYPDAFASVSTCSTTTNSDGFYRIGFDASLVEIIVRPAKAECVFRPTQIAYYEPDRALRNENFTAFCGVLHSISGRVLDADGDPVVGAGLTIRDVVSHWGKTVFTSQSGSYRFEDIVPGATYRVTPFLSGYTFDPPQRLYESLGRDFDEQDFTATEVAF